MTVTKEMKHMIIEEVKHLKNIDDCVGIKINNNKGLFFQVVDYGDEKEYLIELNNVDEENVYEPCMDYNSFSEFGNMEKLIKSVEEYLN